MRINLNNKHISDKLIELCQLYECSPTQLIIELIDNEYAQGCKNYAKVEEDTKDGL
jgi:hypothetical protein